MARSRRRAKLRWQSVAVMAVVVVGVMLALYFGDSQPQAGILGGDGNLPVLSEDDAFDAVFLDVGQGDCTIILSRGRAALIDAGENGQDVTVLAALRAMGVTHLDVVIGSHAHSDHVGALDEVLQSVSAGEIYMPMTGRDTSVYAAVEAAARDQGLEIQAPEVGQRITLGDVVLTLYGDEGASDLNETSIFVLVEAPGARMMLTGDAGKTEENWLLEQVSLKPVDVLQVGHHGSSGSTGREFLQSVWPQYAVIQVGRGNSYGHPTAATLKSLYAMSIWVFRQDECGNVYVDVNEAGECVVNSQYPAVQPYGDTQKEAA